MSNLDFKPFYERWATQLKMGAVGKLFISILFGMLFFVPYFAVSGSVALNDWSWLLALLISAALVFLFYATATLRALFPFLEKHLCKGQPSNFSVHLRALLSDRNFLLAGLFFGTANLSMGFVFGVVNMSPLATGILYGGFFLAGFICGLPALGIFGVVTAFRRFTRNTELQLDYTAPDRCGGMSVVGNALVKFSVITLLEGMLVAAFILLYPWTHAVNPWVQLMMWLWIVFPFFLSTVVLIVPSIDLNAMLVDYRQNVEQAIKAKLSQLRNRIESAETTGVARDEMRNEYDYLKNRREEVHHMQTWPFSLRASTSFAGAFFSNLILAVELGRKLL